MQTIDQSNDTIEHNQQKNKISRMFWTKPFPVLDYPQWSTWVQTAVNNNLDKNDNSKIITRNEGNTNKKPCKPDLRKF